MALLHDPDILFLDEPTIGLDVMAKDQIRMFLQQVNREKKVTIILTTHDLKDIESICPRMIIVNKGQLVYDGSVEQLKAQMGGERKMTVEFAHDPGPLALPGAQLLHDEGKRKTFLFNRGDATALELISKISREHPVADVSFQDADIEEVIRKLYKQLETSSYQPQGAAGL